MRALQASTVSVSVGWKGKRQSVGAKVAVRVRTGLGARTRLRMEKSQVMPEDLESPVSIN